MEILCSPGALIFYLLKQNEFVVISIPCTALYVKKMYKAAVFSTIKMSYFAATQNIVKVEEECSLCQIQEVGTLSINNFKHLIWKEL